MDGEEREEIAEEKRESPIPMKIQQVLEKFQERLSEKDDQISTLQKQIETLQNGAHYMKSSKTLPQRATARPSRDPQSSSASSFPNSRRIFRPAGRPPPSTSTYVNKGKSRSVPSSPSKKINVAPKTAVSRPHSRQAASGSEQSTSAAPKLPGTRSFIEKNKQRFRTTNGIVKQAEKKSDGKLTLSKVHKSEDKATSSNLSKSTAVSNAAATAARDPAGVQLLRNGNNQCGKSVDSGSSYSADSRASSAADFVSVSGSPSPGVSIDGSNHTDTSCPPFLEEDALSYIELTTRLKRMTEEHDKLQAEHSRVLALLVDKRREEKQSKMGDPCDFTELSITESSALISDRNHLEMIESSSENTLASTDSDQLFSEQKIQSEATIKDFCKQEVLRLREELLALQKYKTELEKKLDESNNEVKELIKEKERLQERESEMTNETETLLEKFTVLQKECQMKEDKIIELEKEIEILQKQCHHQQQQLELKQQHILEYKHQLQEKSILLQEMEKESNEMKEFMQAERSTLSEALAEAEAEMMHLKVQLEVKSQNLQELQTSEQSHRLENLRLKDELESLTKFSQGKLKQDIQLTRFKVAFHQLIQNLQIIINYVAYHVDPLEANKIKNEFNDSTNDLELQSSDYVSVATLNREESLNNNLPEALSIEESLNNAADLLDNSLESMIPQDLYYRTSPSSDLFEGEDVSLDLKWDNISNISSEGSIANTSNNNVDGVVKSNKQQQLMNLGDCEHLLKQMHHAQNLVSCLGRLLKDLVSEHDKRCALAEENRFVERMQKELKRQLCLSEGKMKNLQSEMDLLHSNEKRIHQDLKKAINKQNETQRALQLSQNKYTQLTSEFESLTEQQHEINLMREQMQEMQKTKKVLEMEKKLIGDQLTEAMNKICQFSSTNPSEAGGFSVAESLNEKYKLKNEVQKLTLQVLEKENEIANCKAQCLKHKELLRSNWKYADAEVKQMDNVFMHVLETLRTIPDIVGSCEPLHKLWLELEDDDSRTKT